MATSATLLSMAHERKVENLRAFMVNLANSRGFSLPETKLFDQKFLDLCLSRTPDHPTYSAMIFIAITELNEEGGSCKEAISEFVKSKYKNLPYAHTSFLSHHLAKLVEKREILCNHVNHCYTLPGENKTSVSSTDAERKSDVITNDQHAVNEVEEPEVALGNSESEGRIDANSGGGELFEVVVLDEQNDVLVEESGKEEEYKVDIISEQRNAKFFRISNTMKEECVEVKSEAFKRLWECQTETCSNIVALEKMLKQCREKDQQNKAVSEIDDVSHLPLSMESCKELRKLAHKIQSQLSEMIDSFDEAVVPNHESRGCEIEHTSEVSEKTSKQLEQKEKEFVLKKKPQVKKTRVKRLRDIETKELRKSPRMLKLV